MSRHHLVMMLLVVTLGGLSQAGCVVSQSARFVVAPQYASTSPASVQVLREYPSQPYESLGEVLIEPQTVNGSEERLADALREQGARLGADAVVVVFDHIVRAGYWRSDWDIQPYYGRGVRAVAIKLHAGAAKPQITRQTPESPVANLASGSLGGDRVGSPRHPRV